MPPRSEGVELLSALRREGSASALREVPSAFFLAGEEREAFTWLCEYVHTHRAFPAPRTFLRETGVEVVRVPEPVSYYVARARERALYLGVFPKLQAFSEALRGQDASAAVEVAREVLRVERSLSLGEGGVVTLESALRSSIDDQELTQWISGLRGVATGWAAIDAVTDGWQQGDLITFVGRPGQGKSWVLLHSAYSAWAAGRSVLFVSMEMTVLQVIRRVQAMHTGVNPRMFRRGLSTGTFDYVKAAAVTMTASGIPFNFVAGNFKKSVETIRAICMDSLPDVICVDAAYLLTPEKKRQGQSGRRETVSDVIEELGALAKDFNRPVLVTVQFNRQAVRQSARTGANAEEAHPLAHLGLEKIAETDVVGQVSSLVFGLAAADPPHQADRRWLGLLKGREGEQGQWLLNYSFTPVPNFSVVPQDAPSAAGTAPIVLDF